MGVKEKVLILFLFVLIGSLFFYKTFLYGFIPFPGDLLVSEYSPWKYSSYLGYNPGSIPSKVQYFDTIRQLYPWKILAINIFKSGEVPFWNPYNFSGSPLMANFQSAVFYPFNIFYFIVQQKIAWTIIVFIQPLLSAFFTYLFLREIRLSKKASFFSSIAFSFSLFMSVFLEYAIIGNTYLWLPLLLLLVEKLIKKMSVLNIYIFCIALVFSFLAGHIQIFSFVLLFVLAYIFFRLYFSNLRKEIRKSYLIFFSILILLSFGIVALQLFPTIELINLSARVSQEYPFLIEKLLIQPSQLILFLSPDLFGNPATHSYLLLDSYPGNALYIGLIPFIFAVFGFSFKKNMYVKFFSFISLFLLLFFVRSPFSEIFYKIQIPFFSTSSPQNGIFLLSFSLSVLSAFGIDNYSTAKIKKSFYLVFVLISILFLFIFISRKFFHLAIVSNNLVYSTLIFCIFLILFFLSNFIKGKNVFIFLFTVITIADLFYFFQKFNPFVSSDLIFPKANVINFFEEKAGINRFWGYGFAEVQSNFTSYYNLFSPDGYDPLYPKIYGEFIESSKNGKIQTRFDNLNRSDAVIAKGFGETNFQVNNYRLKILNLLGVKYILDRYDNATSEKTFPIENFNLTYDKEGWRIFENLNSVPRIFLASSYKTFRDKEEFEEIFFSDSFNPSKTVLLEENLGINLDDSNGLGIVNIKKYSPNEIVLDVSTDSNQLLFISDTFYPGWKATINRKETKIYRADYSFKSVLVPLGNHKVSFKYEPGSFYLGLKISIISLFLLILFSFFVTKIRFNEK